MDKTKFKDSMGRGLTQSLFLEINYDPKVAVYTLEDNDKTYKGEVFPSLKKLYLAEEDLVEYDFASKHLLGWDHWMKLNGNRQLKRHFDKWRIELELSIRSAAIKSIIDTASDSDKGFQASKWLADRGWDKRAAGRPSKEDVQRETSIMTKIQDEYAEDFERLN